MTAFSRRLQENFARINSGLDVRGRMDSGTDPRSLGAVSFDPRSDLRFDGAIKNPKEKKPKKDEIADEARELARYVDNLQNAIEKTEHLTEVEKARRFLQGLGATGEIEQVRNLVKGLAEQIDKEKELARLEKEHQEFLQNKRATWASADGDAVNARNARLAQIEASTSSRQWEERLKDWSEIQAKFDAGMYGNVESEETTAKMRELAEVVFGVGAAMKETGDIWGSVARGFAADLEDAIVSGESLTNVIGNLGSMIQRVFVRQVITGPLESAFSDLFKGFSFSSLFGFEKGGVMTSGGPLPLRTYAAGGIASSPQLAMYGEGSMNEAFVPLPDGRRIPVALKGGGGRPVVVNIYNSIGNIASQSDVVTGMKAVRAQIIGELSRQQRMGVSFA